MFQPNRNPATAHLFIINPLSGEANGQSVLYSSIDRNRIAALEQLAAQMGVGRSSRHPGPARSAPGPWGRRRPWA